MCAIAYPQGACLPYPQRTTSNDRATPRRAGGAARKWRPLRENAETRYVLGRREMMVL